MAKNISTVIEITDYHIKLLQAQGAKGRARLITCDIEAIESHTEENLFKLFKRVVFRHYIQTDRLALVLPRKFVILKQLRIPSVNEAEIGKMVGLQLVNQIPYPVQDVVYEAQKMICTVLDYCELSYLFLIHFSGQALQHYARESYD